MRALAIGTFVVTAAVFAGCDSGSDRPATEGSIPRPTGGGRGPEGPDDELHPTDEALQACGWTFPLPPIADSPEALALEQCLRGLRPYPDPVRTPIELVRSELHASG